MTLPRQLDELNNSSRDQLSKILALGKVGPVILPLIVDLVREVVPRVVEKKLEDFYATKICNCRKQLTNSEQRTLELKFLDKIQTPIYTGRKIEGEGSASIRLALFDCLTGEPVKSGCEATARIELVVLKGDSNGDGGDNLTVGNFDSKIVETRRGKKPLLKGHNGLNLKEGICDLGEISFIHNSCWMKISKLCLAARVLDSFSGTTINPAKTEYFMLKDCRNTLYGKKYPPTLCNAVWRLKNIGKKGAFRDRLNRENIDSVEDFLKLLYMEPERLQKILCAGAKTWEVITEHAKTCMIDEKEQFCYRPNPQQNNGVVFNVVGQLKGILEESKYVPVSELSEKEKANANKLVIRAFRDGEELTPYINKTSFMKTCPSLPDSTTLESPNVCNNVPPMTINLYNCTQPGNSSHVTVSSTNCIGESGHSHFQNDDEKDFFKEFFKQDLDHPINSPETAHHSFDYHGLQFLSNNYQSVPQTDQSPPGILLVDSRDVSTNDKIQKIWRRLFVVLNAIVTVKSIGDSESVCARKKRKVS